MQAAGDDLIIVRDSIIKYRFETESDSSISFKYDYVYSLSGKILKETYCPWDDDLNNYYESSKKEYTYDDKDSLLEWHSYSWDNITNSWENGDKEGYVYNDKGYTIEKYFARWEDDGNYWTYWSYSWREVNDDGLITSMRIKTWDYDSLKLTWFSGYDKTYDDNGHLLEHITYTSHNNGDTLIKNEKHEYEYDQNNNQTSYSLSSWDQETSEWILSTKQTWAYNDQGAITSYLAYKWNTETAKWQNDSKEQYLFYESEHTGLDSLMFTYRWNSENEVWDTIYKNSYFFNDADQALKTIYYSWNTSSEVWREQKMEMWEYEDGKVSRHSTHKMFSFGYDPVRDYQYTYDDKDSLIRIVSWKLFSGGMFGVETDTKYSYDDNGNRTNFKEIKYDRHGVITSVLWYNYSYDSLNNLLIYTNYLHNEGSISTLKYKEYYYYSPNAIVEPSAYEVNLDGSTSSSTKLKIRSNVDWSITNNSNWLSLSTNSGSGSDSLYIEASKNVSGQLRSDTLTLSANGISPIKIFVSQDISISTGIMNNNIESQLMIYPNPTHNIIKVQSSKQLPVKKIHLYDAEGKLLYEKSANIASTNAIDLSGFSDHLFILKVDTESQTISKQIIKN